MQPLPIRRLLLLSTALMMGVADIQADGIDGSALEEVRVVGTALSSNVADLDDLPFAGQRFEASDFNVGALFSAVDLLEDRATSVSSNAAQNNRLQPDLQYRGFTASPLLGLSQGLVVYQNGVRVNEAFGDTVNWDLLPASSIEQLDLIGGSNPVYGLNAIGGAIALRTRTGFSSEGGSANITLGDFGTRDVGLSHGGNSEDWGWFIAADHLSEDGWRDYSNSDASTLYGALSWRGERTDVDFFLNLGDTHLRGNGPVPVELMAADRSAVFTHPDITENKLDMISASLRHQFDDSLQLAITAFNRNLNTRSFNGDGSEYEACGQDDDDIFATDAIEGGADDDGDFDGLLCNEDGDLVLDKNGLPVSDDFNAINNRSRRKQHSYGLTGQLQGHFAMGTLDNQWVAGLDWFRGTTRFASSVEFAELDETRGTSMSGRFDREGDTNLSTRVETFSVFASDSIALSEVLALTVSARYNNTETLGDDPSGQRPELAGRHRYQSLNGGVGIVWDFAGNHSLYANAQTSTRAPTPVELACSHPDAPCTLPNSFLADPPLDDVTSVSIELGLRGRLEGVERYRLGAFIIQSNDDILFQTVGGVSSNEGFFQNVADTRRQGLELELAGTIDSWQWWIGYTWLQATFDSAFTAASANNPGAENGMLPVQAGDHIPLLPEHNLKLGLATQPTEWLTLGADYRYQSGIYLRGDEANIDTKTNSWGVVDFYASATLGQHWYLEARLDNAFDKNYETFGLYGEADEVLTEIEDDSNRFLGPAMPRMWWLTVGARW